MTYIETTCSGAELRDQCTYAPKEELFRLRGRTVNKGQPMAVPITEELLSKHILLLGSIGSGKTNTFNWIARELIARMTAEDVMIVFDTKGDFYREFYRPGDVVISNDRRACGPKGPDYWNIFREVAIDDRQEENVLEIAKTLFTEKLERSSQPFFPTAAKDLFAALMLDLLRRPGQAALRNNYDLRCLFDSFSVMGMKGILAAHPDLTAMRSYIGDPKSGQTLGVVAELQQLVREVFVGNFARKGGLSIRELVRDKGGKRVFIEYDLSLGATLEPIYRLIVDLAIKQALCRSEKETGNVYFLLDEFRLLPQLQHIDNGVNFGRSLGAKFVVGVQNVDQVAAAYGEEKAASLLSGFSTLISFRVNDKSSRDYIRGRYGESVLLQTYSSKIPGKEMQELMRQGTVVEDADVTALRPGQAIVGIMDCEPFRIWFDPYPERGKPAPGGGEIPRQARPTQPAPGGGEIPRQARPSQPAPDRPPQRQPYPGAPGTRTPQRQPYPNAPGTQAPQQPYPNVPDLTLWEPYPDDPGDRPPQRRPDQSRESGQNTTGQPPRGRWPLK